MNVNRKGDKIAPHKAIMLLTIIELIERGILTEPFIPLSDELVKTFNNIWEINVPATSPFSCKISYPFFHLQTSPFWELVKSPTYIGRKEYSSVASLRHDFIGAKIDNTLFQYLSLSDVRDEIRLLLKEYYLSRPSTRTNTCKLGLLTFLSLICSVA